jgi:hypothetical protein
MDHHARHLAGNGACNVGQCTCGMLHVTVGPLTLRLEPGAAGTLRDVLTAALTAIAEPRASRPSGPGGPPHLRLASSRGDDLS